MSSFSECETAGKQYMQVLILRQLVLLFHLRALFKQTFPWLTNHWSAFTQMLFLRRMSRVGRRKTRDSRLTGGCSGGGGAAFLQGALRTHHSWGSVVKKLKMEMCWCIPARKSQPNCSVPKATQAWQVRNWTQLRNSAGERESEGVINAGLSPSYCSCFKIMCVGC